MKIGLVNMFSFRPHVEQLFFLAHILEQAGHELFYLTCDAAVENCYPRAIKGTSKAKECSKCMLGGVRSFTAKRVTGIDRHSQGDLSVNVLDDLAMSSSCTLTRTESENEWDDAEVAAVRASLHGPINSTYSSARRWISENKLEGVVCFNGRMDLTRAVTYACEQASIPFITHERPWFSEGLQLTPNANCLSLQAVGELVAEYEERPLTALQVGIAGSMAARRFLQGNALEWRLYNTNPEPAPWPLSSPGPRVLVLPSSKNEFAGHAEWKTEWVDNTLALDDFFEAFGISPAQVVIRCHPNWAENIGRATGERSSKIYRNWAQRRGIHCIQSEQKASTADLIQQADMIVLNGGSSCVEAGVCGKQVICLGPSTYIRGGFVRAFLDKASMYAPGAKTPLDPDTVIRKTLRFLYVRSHRHPQFVDYVRPMETTRYSYRAGADASRIVNMLKTGKLLADDPIWAADESEEDRVVELLKQKKWGELAEFEVVRPALPPLEVKRRPAFRWVDGVRAKMPRGDRG
ncbi:MULTISPECIES: capsule biosynthesis protein [Pseudomonas]|uniref:Capsule biosynthesis protein n=1 Tax=Pseudomonas taiwanensis TaxID=470150 RepID=A0ABR6V8Y6_9PSED|nr:MULTISPECIES: capsule biosynthesis protein [Pseudomonas]AVD86523.1 capsule biosynthesis protein [Pseudomonas sp. SWI44]MBC3476317.1 capsule biosynthesis protein [Pseudomonas taiwanensis]MBC3493993.1 capsule biosynthesis protein [Pseudomonas taiwanensis]